MSVDIINATITQHKPRAASSVGGGKNYGAPVTLDAGCFLDVPTRKQKIEAGGKAEIATAIVYVAKSALPGGWRPGDEDLLTVAINHGPTVEHEIVTHVDREADDDISHFEIYLRKL